MVFSGTAGVITKGHSYLDLWTDSQTDKKTKWCGVYLSHGDKTIMPNGPKPVGTLMRPNIQISHSLNGQVKDFAAKHDLSTGEAYRLIIRTGLEELEERDELPDLYDEEGS